MRATIPAARTAAAPAVSNNARRMALPLVKAGSQRAENHHGVRRENDSPYRRQARGFGLPSSAATCGEPRNGPVNKGGRPPRMGGRPEVWASCLALLGGEVGE